MLTLKLIGRHDIRCLFVPLLLYDIYFYIKNEMRFFNTNYNTIIV